jgi:hypothetical protein
MRRLVAAVIAAITLSGCGEVFSGPDLTDEAILTRDDAIRYAPGIYEVAVRQGYDLKRGRCIFDDFGQGAQPRDSEWVIAVDWKGGQPFETVARACPAYASGDVRHAVVMSLDGEIIAAR